MPPRLQSPFQCHRLVDPEAGKGLRQSEKLEMAGKAEDPNLGDCSFGFHHLGSLAKPRALGLKG